MYLITLHHVREKKQQLGERDNEGKCATSRLFLSFNQQCMAQRDKER